VGERPLAHDIQHFIVAHDVHEHPVGDDERNNDEDEILQGAFPDFFGVPFLPVELHLFVSVAFDQIIYLTENHFQKYCLWTNPSAKNTAEDNGKQDNENDRGDGAQSEDKEVLRKERLSHDEELP